MSRTAHMLWGNTVVKPSPISQAIISFTATASPTILDYDTTYAATYGQYPKFMLLLTDEDGNELESQSVPKRIITAGALTSIVWDLGEPATGKIIMYK